MKPVSESDRFQALDACHEQIHVHLSELTNVLEKLQAGADESQYRDQLRTIEAFFTGNALQHHLEEDKNVFPKLLTSDNPELVQAVRTLQQDHRWIEQNWLELSPMLRAIISGQHGVDMAELQHSVEVFLALLHDHIMLEETLIYPEAKGQFAQQMAARAHRSAG